MKFAPLFAVGRLQALATTSASKTSVALRNLRGFVILIVVAFHSFLAYLGSQSSSPLPFDSPPYHWKAIPITDSQRWFGFDLFCASQYVYLMQFMFFLSGLFVWPSLRRKGGSTFIRDRTLRLGVPFLLSAYLLMPVAHYPVYRVSASDPSWSAFWDHWAALPFWPTGPLWFVWYLLALNIAAAAPILSRARLGRVPGSAIGEHWPRPIFPCAIGCLRAGVHPICLGLQAMGLGSIRPVRLPGELRAALYCVFFRRRWCWGGRHRKRPAGI